MEQINNINNGNRNPPINNDRYSIHHPEIQKNLPTPQRKFNDIYPEPQQSFIFISSYDQKPLKNENGNKNENENKKRDQLKINNQILQKYNSSKLNNTTTLNKNNINTNTYNSNRQKKIIKKIIK